MSDLLGGIARVGERVARDEAPKDLGALASSITAEVRRLEASVVATAPHARVMEEGRRPGAQMPPPEALAGWASRHGFSGSLFVLARAIGRRGIPGRWYMKKAAAAMRAALPGAVAEAARRIGREWGRR
jgi:hypothetical protein